MYTSFFPTWAASDHHELLSTMLLALKAGLISTGSALEAVPSPTQVQPSKQGHQRLLPESSWLGDEQQILQHPPGWFLSEQICSSNRVFPGSSILTSCWQILFLPHGPWLGVAATPPSTLFTIRTYRSTPQHSSYTTMSKSTFHTQMKWCGLAKTPFGVPMRLLTMEWRAKNEESSVVKTDRKGLLINLEYLGMVLPHTALKL